MKVFVIGICIMMAFLVSFSNAAVDDSVLQALNDFYDATAGSSWKNNANWPVGDPCDDGWFGIYCDGNKEKVISIMINYNNLVGTFPESFSDLVDLQSIYLMGNSLSGSISTLCDLDKLSLLYLSHNHFNSQLPPSFGNLHKLVALDISYNSFTGQIPTSLNDFVDLTLLEFQKNSFVGPIPELTLPSINSLSIRFNQLSGTIPESLGSLPSLTTLLLNNNQLSGELPSFLQNRPPQLTVINLANNQFECPLPNWCSADDGGDGTCEPCISSHPISATPSPHTNPPPVFESPSPSVAPSISNSTNDGGDDNNNDDGGSSSLWLLMLLFLLVCCCGGILVAIAVAVAAFMKVKKIGPFGKFEFISEDENGQPLEQDDHEDNRVVDDYSLGDSNLLSGNDGDNDDGKENNSLVDPNAI